MAYSSYNYGTNMFSGAGQGAAAGAAASGGNPWATGAGGIIGLIGGWFQSAAEAENLQQRLDILDAAAQQLGMDYNNIELLYTEFAKNYTPGGWTYDENGNKVSAGEIAMQKAASKINNWDQSVADRFKEAGLLDENGKLNTSAMKFNYDKNVEDFVNPYMGNVIDASNAKVQHSASGAGLGRSTGAAKAIAENTAKEYDQIYKTGLDAYQADRNQAYQEWNSYLSNVNNTLGNILKADQYGIEQQRSLGDDFLQMQSDLVDSKAGILRDKSNAGLQVQLNKADAYSG